MDDFRNEFIKGLLDTLKIPATAFNIALVSDEIENISNTDLREFYKSVVTADTFGNGMKAIINTAKKFKPEEKDLLAGTEDKAKVMYDKFYSQQSAMTDYSQSHRDEVPNDRDWFRSIDYSKLKNRDGSQTYTKQELYVLQELGGGEFILDLPFKENSQKVIALIKKTIDKAITTKYSEAKGIENKHVVKMIRRIK